MTSLVLHNGRRATVEQTGDERTPYLLTVDGPFGLRRYRLYRDRRTPEYLYAVNADTGAASMFGYFTDAGGAVTQVERFRDEARNRITGDFSESRAQQVVAALLEGLSRRGFLQCLGKGAAAAVVAADTAGSSFIDGRKASPSFRSPFPALPNDVSPPIYDCNDIRVRAWQKAWDEITLANQDAWHQLLKRDSDAWRKLYHAIMQPNSAWRSWFDARIPGWSAKLDYANRVVAHRAAKKQRGLANAGRRNVNKQRRSAEANPPEKVAKAPATQVWPLKPARDRTENEWFDEVPESRVQQIVAVLLDEGRWGDKLRRLWRRRDPEGAGREDDEDFVVWLPPGATINRFDDQGFDIEHVYDPQLGKWWHYARLGRPESLMFYARSYDSKSSLYTVDVYQRTSSNSWVKRSTIEIPYDSDAKVGWKRAIKPAVMESEEEIAVDLDGTLAKDSGWKGISHIGDPVPKMLKRVQDWIADGKKVVVFTARAHDPKAIQHVEKWLKKHGLPRLEVTNEKRPSMVSFYDDKAVAVKRNKGVDETLRTLREF